MGICSLILSMFQFRIIVRLDEFDIRSFFCDDFDFNSSKLIFDIKIDFFILFSILGE
jgi:hypothetical protein